MDGKQHKTDDHAALGKLENSIYTTSTALRDRAGPALVARPELRCTDFLSRWVTWTCWTGAMLGRRSKPAQPQRKMHGRGNNWPVPVCAGHDSPPPPCLASPLGGADAAQDDGLDYDDAGGDDDGPTRPQRKMHGRGNNWPVPVCAGLDSPPPPCLASPLGGADAAQDDGLDYDDAGGDDDGPTRPQRKKARTWK